MVIRSRFITDAVGAVLFDKFGVHELYFVVGNVLPLYCSDYDTGLVVECGFTHLQVLPVSLSIIRSHKESLISKDLKRLISECSL